MFVELHTLQNFVPSNLNRDDNNYPKTTDFGGARRARISSQCIKRAVRFSDAFRESFGTDIGTRTQWLARLLEKPLIEAHPSSPEDAQAVALAFAKAYTKMSKKKTKKGATAVLIFLSPAERREFAGRLLAKWHDVVKEARAADVADTDRDDDEKKGESKGKPDDKSTLKEIVADLIDDDSISKRTDAPDIALFGRMLADHPETNIGAACQVANALSTHAIEVEYDYFTAMDDVLQQEDSDETGAGMINVTGFNSACYYRYALLDWKSLNTNLNDDVNLARRTADAFLRAWIETVPTGMKNRFAPNNMPDFVLAVVRTGGPGWSLANAFEKPVKPSNTTGWLEPSVRALDEYWNCLYTGYANDDGKAKEVKSIHFFALKPELAEAAKNLNAESEQRAATLMQWRRAVLEALTE